MPTAALYSSGRQHPRAPLNPSASPLLAALASNGPYRRSVKGKIPQYPAGVILTRYPHTNTGMVRLNTLDTRNFRRLNTYMNPTQIRRR